MKIFKEFKEFAMRGNMIDMAVGIVIGAAFGAIVSSLVADIIMPPIGMALGDLDFSNLFWVMKDVEPTAGPYATIQAAHDAGAVTFNYGKFILTLINFLIIALSVFMMVRVINKMHRHKEAAPSKPTTKECPYCKSSIAIEASRCAFCTSQLEQK